VVPNKLSIVTDEINADVHFFEEVLGIEIHARMDE
jgi:hypothetical protein